MVRGSRKKGGGYEKQWPNINRRYKISEDEKHRRNRYNMDRRGDGEEREER